MKSCGLLNKQTAQDHQLTSLILALTSCGFVYYTQNQMAFGLEMAKDICALGWCTVLYTVLLTCTPQLHFWCRKLSSIVRTLCTNQYIPSQKCFVCTRNIHQDSSDWKRWRSIDFSEEESHRGPRKKQTFAVAQLSQVMLMICLSQSINLSRQNQRFTTQNHEWCIEPMRCCHAVLPHVLVWRTIG